MTLPNQLALIEILLKENPDATILDFIEAQKVKSYTMITRQSSMNYMDDEPVVIVHKFKKPMESKYVTPYRIRL